jgi:hypothetical protein
MNPYFKTRGSVMLSIIIFSSVMLLLVASLLSWGISERRLNIRSQLRLEARNAAEALAEYGFSQIRQKFETRSTFSLKPGGTDELQKPPAPFWTGSNVDVASNDLIGGTIETITTPGSSYYFVDPADENNKDDPLKGKFVFRRDVKVIARATVIPPDGGTPITSHVSERLSVRGAPLFAHAIFYNMDLEIFNGPEMIISGPVHANGNLYLYPQTGKLQFSSQVTATGHIYHAKKPGDTSTDGNSASGRTADINFLVSEGVYKSLKNTNADWDWDWNDSTKRPPILGENELPVLGEDGLPIWPGFQANAMATWKGNLKTAEHGVTPYTPVAIGGYQEDPTPTNGTDNTINSGRAIIEPTNYPDPTTKESDPEAYDRKMAVEEQKYANNAGLYIQVDPADGTITAYSRSKDNPAKNKVLTLPASSGLVEYQPYKRVANYTSTQYTKTYKVSTTGTGSYAGKFKYKLWRVTNTAISTITYTSSGSTTTTGAYAPVPNSGVWEGNETGYLTSPPANPAPSTPTGTPPLEDAAVHESGMYDKHREKKIDIIELDMDALRKAVASMTGATSATLSTGTSAAVAPADAVSNLSVHDWTGIVYVEVTGAPTTSVVPIKNLQTGEIITPAGATISATNSKSLQTGVRIVNGKGKVPSVSSEVGALSSEGLTIATNVPVYIKGSFNADGTTTLSPNSATAAEAGETPAAIVGDAVTILSQSFSDSASRYTANPTATTSTIEISAALLTGLTPTNKNGTGKTSGGAHNLPRFLENWSSKNVFLRGSLVALFESRVFTEPHGSGYYSPPNRNWGFNELFKNGRFPPGTPRVMSYERVDFTNLSPTKYEWVRDEDFDWDNN